MNEVLKKYVIYYGIAISFVLLMLLYSMFCTKHLPDYGARADQVREQLNGAVQTQQEITSRVTVAQTAVEQIADRIDYSQGANNSIGVRADHIETNLHSSGELISECQQILRDVRARTKSEK